MKTNKYFELVIQHSAADRPGGESSIFDQTVERYAEKWAVLKGLEERYGRVPGGRNKIYVDDQDGNARAVGFLHSFWNSDISHNSKKWFQTDWITVYEVERETIDILKEGGKA